MSRCGRCSAEVVASARFCSECGSWVVHDPPVVSPEASTGLEPLTAYTGERPIVAKNQLETKVHASQPPPASVPPPPVSIPNPRRDVERLASRTDVGRVAPSLGELRIPPLSIPDFSSEPSATPISRPAISTPRSSPSAPPPPSIESRASRTIIDPPTDAPPPSAAAPRSSFPSQRRKLGAFLVSYQYDPLGTFWPLAVGKTTVGRAGSRANPDVAIADSTVSTEQAVVTIDDTHLGVEDRRSTNGTFVNGKPLLPGAVAPIRHGDRLRFGSFETIVVVVPYPASGK